MFDLTLHFVPPFTSSSACFNNNRRSLLFKSVIIWAKSVNIDGPIPGLRGGGCFYFFSDGLLYLHRHAIGARLFSTIGNFPEDLFWDAALHGGDKLGHRRTLLSYRSQRQFIFERAVSVVYHRNIDILCLYRGSDNSRLRPPNPQTHSLRADDWEQIQRHYIVERKNMHPGP